jgi:serpin B
MKRRFAVLLLFAVGPLAWAAEPFSAVKRPAGITRRPARSLDSAACRAGNRFALDLYAELRGQSGNLFLSPHSIATALTLASSGARGETRAQMRCVLHLTAGEDAGRPGSSLLALGGSRIQQRDDKGTELQMANALWAAPGQPFSESFVKQAQAHGTVKQVDFTDGESARQIINRWVEKQTGSHIKEALRPGAVDRQTKMVLTNAVYFNAAWASPFKKSDTRDGTFHIAPGRSVPAPLMSQVGQFSYGETVGLRVLELPYAGKELSLVVLLPKKADGLPALEKALSVKRLGDCLAGLKRATVEVILPRFRLGGESRLNEPLSRLGMPLAFSGEADFSAIDKKGGLCLSAVVHKACIDLNEQGTEATASTTATVKAKAVAVPTHVFRANRPFVFLILDNRSGSILFLGRLTAFGGSKK